MRLIIIAKAAAAARARARRIVSSFLLFARYAAAAKRCGLDFLRAANDTAANDCNDFNDEAARAVVNPQPIMPGFRH